MTTSFATLTYLQNMADNYANGRTSQRASSAKLISIVTGKRLDFVENSLKRLVLKGKVEKIRNGYKIA